MSSTRPADAARDDYAARLIRFKAHQLTRTHGFSASDLDDLVQELQFWLLRRMHHFDPKRGAVSTFINRTINSAVASILRDRGRLKRAAGIALQSIDQPVDDAEGAAFLRDMLRTKDVERWTGIETAMDTPESRELAERVKRACATLPADVAPIAAKLMLGTKPASIAREMGISRRQVRNAIDQIREHLAAHGLDET